ncbi:MAG: helix-turn-helix transcriptional regulator [Acidimicrobiales bacterium]|nr:helix-turn-helix transcriptional regulator [Acidimicrobiales bacterium]
MVQVADRRARNRLARREQYLRAAMRIVSEDGIDRLTMQRMADDLDCAVGTIYTYFSSKDALLAELQRLALDRITESYRRLQARVDPQLDDRAADEVEAALARLVLGLRFWVSTAEVYPEESNLFRALTTRRTRISDDEAANMLPSAWQLFAMGTANVQVATDVGAISPGNAAERMVTAAAALGGVLLLEGIAHFDPDLFAGRLLALRFVDDVIRGWGADAAQLASAAALADALLLEGPLVPDVPGIDTA